MPIIGCVLFGIGDWLLGFVDPAKVNGDVCVNKLLLTAFEEYKANLGDKI